MQKTIEINTLYDGTAKLQDLPEYIAAAKIMAGSGNHVTLTGPGPVWLFLAIAHALYGLALSLTYYGPVTGKVLIFDNDPKCAKSWK